ncbi:alpha/beta hydrolase fold domain-containing protein, partial [Massilia solisilvae]
MPTHLWRPGAVLALAVAGLAQAQPFQPQVAASVVEQDRYPQGQPAFPRGVTGLPGLVYATDPGYAPLRLDLYLPPGAASSAPRPLVVFVHDGGWHGGSRRTNGAFADWPLALAALAARGYVVASIDYRLAPQANFPAPVQDVKDALRWLRSKAGAYGIDRAKVLVWGAGAGAHLAALAAVSCGAAGLDRP